MKKVISALFAILMAMSMCVAAVAYVVPLGVTNTTDLFDRDAETLNAAKGTPTVDGQKDAIWENAFSYAANKGTAAIMNPVTSSGGSTITSSASIQIRMLWDENNLYILEERFDENYDTDVSGTNNVNGRNTWTGGDKTMYNIIVPTTMDENGGCSSFQLVTEVTQALVDVDAYGGKTVKPVGSTAPAVCWVRENNYNSNIPSLSGKPYVYDYKADADLAGFGGYVRITQTGYMIETVIPWSLLDHDNIDEYTPALGNEFGIKIYPNYGTDAGTKAYHINHSIGDGFAEYCGYAPVKLMKSVSAYITPETDWYTDNMDATEYNIDSAAKLLGLVYLTHANEKYGILPAELLPLPENPTAQQQENYAQALVEAQYEAALRVTKGKTFNITADIDLNPGYTASQYTAPGNIWHGIKYFAGTLNGNGHTISGLYNDATVGTGYSSEMALIQTLTETGVVKNLTLKGEFVADDKEDILDVVAIKSATAVIDSVTYTELVFTVVHDWDNGKVTTEPTHLATGVKTYTCTECSTTKTEELAKLTEHTYGEWTKKDDKLHQKGCACGDIQTTAAHTWDNGNVTTEPTHLVTGEKTYTCTECEATATETLAKLTEHTYGEWTKKNDTQHQKECACGDIETAAHGWNRGVVTTEPTHLATGVKTYTCTECGATATETLAKLTEHTYGEWTVITDPTEETAGEREKACACGHKITEAVPALVHHYQAVVTAPTCTEQGYTTRTCTNCKDSFVSTYVDALGHTYDDDQDASCNVCDEAREIVTEKSGCGATVSSGFGILVLLMGAAVGVTHKKKKQ